MTFGGVPRVCRGPGTHWMAANGGTRTSTVRPGTCCSSSPRLYRTAARSAGRKGSDPASSARVTRGNARRAERSLGRQAGPRRLAERSPLLIDGRQQSRRGQVRAVARSCRLAERGRPRKFLRFSWHLAASRPRYRYSFGMPGQRRTAGPRARGSRLPRLAGFGVAVLVAGGLVTGYLLAFHPPGSIMRRRCRQRSSATRPLAW